MSDAPLSNEIANGMDGMINEVLSRSGGGFVSGFTAFIQYMDEDGERRWSFITQKGQTLMTTSGHVDYLNTIVQRELHTAVASTDQ